MTSNRSAAPCLPRMIAGLEPRVTADDRLFLLRDGAGDDLVVEEDGAFVAELLRNMDGRHTAGDLAARAQTSLAAVEDVIAALATAGLVEDAADDGPALPDQVVERYDRQLAYFRLIADTPRAALDAQRRLSSATVCLVGVGGLGSWTALALASAGIGELVIVDHDRVEISNLNRQVLYGAEDVGRPKIQAAADALARYAPDMRIRALDRRVSSVADAYEVVDGADLVVDAADWPPHRLARWIDAVCLALGIPHLAISQQPPLIRVGPLYRPGVTGCLRCEEEDWRREYPLFDEIAEADQPFASATAFGPACGIIGTLAASEVTHLLAGLGTPRTSGRAVLFDMRTLSITEREVPHSSTCPTCGPTANELRSGPGGDV